MPVGTRWRTLEVEAPSGTPVADYSVSVVGVAEKDTDHPTCPADASGDTASRDGAVTRINGSAGNGGCDAYRVKGYIRDLAIDGESLPPSSPLNVRLDGDAVDLDADLPEALPGEAPQPRISITGVDMSGRFDATASHDPDGEIDLWEWNIGGSWQVGKVVNRVFREEGTYSVTLTVTDNDGRRADASSVVTVPFPEDGETVTPSMTVSIDGLSATFDASASSADSGIASYAWDIAGVSYTGVQATHTFPSPGTYDVTLTVTSEAGETGSLTSNVSAGVGKRDSGLLGDILTSGPRRAAFVAGLSALLSEAGQELGRN